MRCNKETKIEGKESKLKKFGKWSKDHWLQIALGSVYGGLSILAIVGGVKYCHDMKKAETAWNDAMKAFRSGDKNYDYGPYKLTVFSEPFEEKIGDTLMHVDAVKAFLECEK